MADTWIRGVHGSLVSGLCLFSIANYDTGTKTTITLFQTFANPAFCHAAAQSKQRRSSLNSLAKTIHKTSHPFPFWESTTRASKLGGALNIHSAFRHEPISPSQ
jgi:hypothetical protein